MSLRMEFGWNANRATSVVATLFVVGALFIAGCAKKSEYIRFGQMHATAAVGDDKKTVANKSKVSHYVAIVDPKTSNPIRPLKAEYFSVNVKGKTIRPNIEPSSVLKRGHLGIAMVIDQGGQAKSWPQVDEVVNEILLQVGTKRWFAALAGANGQSTKYAFEDPLIVRGKFKQLKATNSGFGLTYSAIGEVENNGREGLFERSQVAIVAVVCGKPGGTAPSLPDGVPLVVVDMTASNDGDLVKLAEDSGGFYIPYSPNQSISLAQRVVGHLDRQLADLWVLGFTVDNGDIPLRYSLTYKNGSVNTTGDFVSDEYTQRYAIILGLAVAIVAIVAIVFISKKRKSNRAAASGWTGGESTMAGLSGVDDDATRAGTDASGYGGSNQPSYGQQPAAYQSQGGYNPPSVDYAPQGGPIGQSPGDVTSGAMGAMQPTMGGYGGPGATGGGGGGGYGGDSTMGEFAAATPAMGVSSGVPPISIRIEGGGAAGRETKLVGPTKIGRGDFFASSFGALTLPGDPKVSREHAEIFPENRSGATVWTVANRSATNKTYLNDMPIDMPRPLNPGDRIRVGETTIRILDLPIMNGGGGGGGYDGDSTMR